MGTGAPVLVKCTSPSFHSCFRECSDILVDCRESGFVCRGGNSSSIQPDTCVGGSYVVDIDFEEYGMQ